MKNQWYFMLLLTVFFTCSSCSIKENNPKIRRIEIHYVSLYTTTFTKVDCDRFYNDFSDSMDHLTITDKKLLSEFEKELNSLQLADSSYHSPDTRIKMKILYENRSEELCFDTFVIEKDGKIYYFSDKFKKLMHRILIIKELW